jgi:CRISPR-associated protein Cmr6
MNGFYLRNDVSELNIDNIDNFALRLNKFPAYQQKNHEKRFSIFFKISRNEVQRVNLDFHSIASQIRDFKEKHLKSISKLPEIKTDVSYFKPEWRLVIGLGSPSVYETSITLHHIYGFPFIPGQAVKGVTRNFVICQYFDKDEEKAEKNDEFTNIFGSTKNKGKVFFFDAYPTEVPRLDYDVINVHYSEYYSGKREPTDDQPPVPISFLTVKNTTFAFPIGLPKNAENEDLTFQGQNISDVIKAALEEKGIGAKTAAGYGHLIYIKSASENYNAAIERHAKEENEKNELSAMTELEREFYHLKNELDIEKIKMHSFKIFANLDSFTESDKHKAAGVLKEKWLECNLWQKQKKKQKDRVNKVKQILGE